MTGNNSRYRAATARDRRLISRLHGAAFWALRLAASIGPTVRVPGLGVIVSEATVMREILLDTRQFAKVGPGSSGDLWTPIIGPNGILNMDGEAHTTIRTQLAPLFTPRFIATLVDDVLDPQIRELTKRLEDGDEVDLVAEIEVTAASLVCRLAGYDLDRTGTDELLSELDKVRGLMGLVTLTTKRFSDAQINFGREQFAEIDANIRRAYRENDTRSVASLLREQGLSEDDTVSAITALIITGTETIVSFVPRFIALLIDSGHIDALATHPDGIADAVSEGLRVIVPSPVMLRAVRYPTTLHRHRVRPGHRIILATYEACARAGDFNPVRPIPASMRQLWFGAGPRFCIGMPLAMAQIRKYVDALVRVHSRAPLTISASARRTTGLIPGYQRLIITRGDA